MSLLTRKKRNVTLDTSVLIAWVISKDDNSIVKKIVLKAVNEDRLMLSDVIYDECLKYGDKRKAKVSREEIAAKLRELGPVIRIKPVPSGEELLKRYSMRDAEDLKILYSVEMTNSVILVTYDDDFTGDVKGITARIMRPEIYLYDGRPAERKRRR
jgi:predicted nucleic acid-binding protein